MSIVKTNETIFVAIDDWKRQNALKTTSESVKRANLDRINQLNYMINLQNNNNY